MSYRIHYPPGRKLRKQKVHRIRLPALTVLSFLLFFLLVRFLWPEGAALLENSVPVSALERFALELGKGQSVMTSVSDSLKALIHDLY